MLYGSYVRTQYTGYTGSGYVDIADRTGSNMEFVFRRESAATNMVTVYYANGGSTRSLSVSLNDAVVSSSVFSGHRELVSWGFFSVTVSVPWYRE